MRRLAASLLLVILLTVAAWAGGFGEAQGPSANSPGLAASGRISGWTAAVTTLSSCTVGASDTSYVVDANVLVTSSVTHSFYVTCAYTDENGTARTLTLRFVELDGTMTTAIANAAGAVPCHGTHTRIRAKAGTSISLITTGTFTSVIYNAEASVLRTP